MVFGNIGKMGEMMKQAKRLKDEIGRARYEGEDSGVKVMINGELEIKELKIPQELPLNKVESIVKDLINRTLKNAKNDMAQKMQKITGGLNLPGM
ncbi:MAG: YbaB/EbfC family nucleoid-associated protein [bacterium]